MARPTFSVFIGVTLDGFIARPDGGIDFLERYGAPGEDYGFAEFFRQIDTLLVGRNTYEVAIGFPEWPYGGKRVAVWTHRPGVPRHGEAFVEGEPEAVAARLAADGARHVYLDGGVTVSAFLAADLVDDLTVTVLPLVLGDGLRLFRPPLPERALALVDARPCPGGLAQLRYRRERA